MGYYSLLYWNGNGSRVESSNDISSHRDILLRKLEEGKGPASVGSYALFLEVRRPRISRLRVSLASWTLCCLALYHLPNLSTVFLLSISLS